MLFTESELNSTNVWNLLETANYLSEDESIISPKTIPVKENSRLGYGVVRFDDVERLSESQGCDYIDAMYMIAEASEMNPEYLAVAVPEEDIIAYPEIVNELANIVIQPLSEDSFAYQYVDMCLEAWDNTGDEGYLGAIIDDACLEEAAYLLMEENISDKEAKKLGFKDAADAARHGIQLGSTDEPTATAGAMRPEFKSGGELKVAGPSSSRVKSGYSTAAVNTIPDVPKHTPLTKTEKLKLTGKGYYNTVKGEYKGLGQDLKAGWNQEGLWNKAKGIGSAFGKHKAATAGAAVAVGAAGYGVYRFAKWVKQARNKPKSWIGQKIAALRGIYQKWMQAAQRNPAQAGMIKSACAKILSIIDALLARLQSAAG